MRHNHPFHRRGAVAVQTAVMSTLLIGCAALAVDVGMMYSARTELQRAADAAALAGVSGLFTDGKLITDDASITTAVHGRARQAALGNQVLGAGVRVDPADIEIGQVSDSHDTHCTFSTCAPLSANAVGVTVRRSPASEDGPVPLYFAAIFGKRFTSIGATAMAAVDDRFAGYRPPADGDTVLIPFTINESLWERDVVSGNDLWTFSEDGVLSSSDGIREVRLYPIKYRQDGTPDGAGTFGVLNVGTGNLGATCVGNQIINGIPSEDLEREIGTPYIRFFDESGNPQTHIMTGDTGISAGLKSALELRIGDVVGFFVHSEVKDPGSNAKFTIKGLRFARVMSVDLTGSLHSKKGLILQPVAYAGSNVITDPGAPPTGGKIGKPFLLK